VFGWYLIKRVRRESSVEMPAPICLTIPVYNSPFVSKGEKCSRSCKAISGKGRGRRRRRLPEFLLIGFVVALFSVARRYLFPSHRPQLCRSDLTNCPIQNRIGSIKHRPIA